YTDKDLSAQNLMSNNRGLPRLPYPRRRQWPRAIVAPSSRQRRRSRANAFACRTINKSIVSRPGVGKLRCVVYSRILELHPQSFPSSSNFSIALCMQLPRLQSGACIMLRKPPHQEQRLGRNTLGWRAGESLQPTNRDGGILLHSQLLLPAAQRTKHLISRFPVDDRHRFQRVAQLLHVAADLVIRLHRGIRRQEIRALAYLPIASSDQFRRHG